MGYPNGILAAVGGICPDGQGGYGGTCHVCLAGSAGKGLTTMTPCTACSGNTSYSSSYGASYCCTCGLNEVANADHTGCECASGYSSCGQPVGDVTFTYNASTPVQNFVVPLGVTRCARGVTHFTNAQMLWLHACLPALFAKYW